jgi:hypothetical protein
VRIGQPVDGRPRQARIPVLCRTSVVMTAGLLNPAPEPVPGPRFTGSLHPVRDPLPAMYDLRRRASGTIGPKCARRMPLADASVIAHAGRGSGTSRFPPGKARSRIKGPARGAGSGGSAIGASHARVID